MTIDDVVIEKKKILVDENKISKLSLIFSEYLMAGYKTDTVKIVDYDYTPPNQITSVN